MVFCHSNRKITYTEVKELQINLCGETVTALRVTSFPSVLFQPYSHDTLPKCGYVTLMSNFALTLFVCRPMSLKQSDTRLNVILDFKKVVPFHFLYDTRSMKMNNNNKRLTLEIKDRTSFPILMKLATF